MGYIRTKNKGTNEENIYPSDIDKNFLDFVDDEIIAQTDTIEELCDEFVVVFEDKNHIVYSQFKWAMDKAIRSGMPFMIYGAIWTDKGLQFVARMNNEVVLELI